MRRNVTTSRLRQGSGSAGYVTVKEYARAEGISVQAAYQRIRNGQLSDGVEHHSGRYWIHLTRAAAAWAHRARPCNSRSAQLEARLMAGADRLAKEIAGESETYVKVALYRWICDILE